MDVKKTIIVLLFPFVFGYTGTIIVDSTPPNIKIIFPENFTIHGVNITILTNVTDNYGIKTCWINYTTIKYFNCKNVTIELKNNTNYIYVYAQDLAGNTNKTLLILYKDSIYPNITSYGFYPYNNTIINNPYSFWIIVKENYGIKEAIFKLNNKSIVLSYNSTVYNISVNLTKENNIITWIVCDFANLCSNVSFFFKVIIPEKPEIYLKVYPYVVRKGESVIIEYEVKNFKEGNLTIIDPRGERFIYNISNKGKIYFKNTNVEGKYKIILFAKNYNYTSKKEAEFYVKRIGYLIIKPLRPTFGKVEIKEGRTKHEEYFSERKYIRLPEGKYDLYVEAFNKTLKALFKNTTIKDYHEILLDKRVNNNSVIYFIKPTFWYNYVNLRLSFKEIVNDLPKSVYKFLEVYKCSDFDYIKHKCNSKWERIRFGIDVNNKEIFYTTSSLSAFKIKLKENICLFNFTYPRFIYSKDDETEFNITVTNIYCKKSFNISVLGAKYEISPENTFIQIGRNKTFLIKIKEFKGKIRLKINDEIVPIYILKRNEKLFEKEKIIISPYPISIITRKGKNYTVCLKIKNLGDKRKFKIISKYFNKTFYLGFEEEKEVCGKGIKEKIGIYNEKINIIFGNYKTIDKISILVLPNSERDISVFVPRVVKANEKFKIKIFTMFKDNVLNVVVCYLIKKDNNIVKRKCAEKRVEGEVGGYKIIKLVSEENLKDPGKYKIIAIAKILGIQIMDKEDLEVVGIKEKKNSYNVVIIPIIVGIAILGFFLLKHLIS